MNKITTLGLFCAFVLLQGTWAPTASAVEGNGLCPGSICGDTNDDGTIVASDALAVLKMAVGLNIPGGYCGTTLISNGAVFKGQLPSETGQFVGQCYTPNIVNGNE